jgi:NADPH-dependent curcumin reductase CurA
VSESEQNRQWRLAAFPRGQIQPTDFEWCERPLPSRGDGQILVRNIYLSLDPTNRLWATGKETYLPPLERGDIMRGGTLGIVEKSFHPRFQRGDLVTGALGDGTTVSRLPRGNRLPFDGSNPGKQLVQISPEPAPSRFDPETRPELHAITGTV